MCILEYRTILYFFVFKSSFKSLNLFFFLNILISHRDHGADHQFRKADVLRLCGQVADDVQHALLQQTPHAGSALQFPLGNFEHAVPPGGVLVLLAGFVNTLYFCVNLGENKIMMNRFSFLKTELYNKQYDQSCNKHLEF